MLFISEKQKKIDELYNKLKDRQEAKKIIESAMHHNYYNRAVYDGLFKKLHKVLDEIEQIKKELAAERKKV